SITSGSITLEEALGIKARRKSRKLWWTDELEKLVEEKKILYLKWLNSKSELDKRTYNDKKNEVRRMVKEEQNKVWRFIKTTTTEKQESAPIEVITNKEWVKYYSNLSENRPEYQERPQPEINTEGEEIYNGRACGPEGVYAELIKSGSEKLFRMLTNIVNQCLNGHPVPEEWKKAYISSIYKKGSSKDPNNYRGISVTSTMSRLYGRILRNLIEEEYSSYEEEEQNGFRGGRSCTDNIFALKQIIEKKSATNQEVQTPALKMGFRKLEKIGGGLNGRKVAQLDA
ncbi:uncharacterized protein LOC115883134, partial [Sitophilus oryzae]|uniref:Uncharacterized protein LOC115883134 n=1 Tax=Sitophilus oryzae TaxID=7048 RepID=A0A6J2Y2T6_SITOR